MRFLRAALIFLWTLLPAAPAFAQDEEETPLPPAPQNLVLDEARLFARQPESLKAVAGALATLEQKHGYRLYFAIYDSLIGERTLDQQAEALRVKWLGEQPGGLLLLESDSFKWVFAQAPPLQQEGEPGQMVQRDRPTGLSDLDKDNLRRTLKPALLPFENKDRAAFAETLAPGAAVEIGQLLDKRAAGSTGPGRTQMLLLAIGLIAVLGLVALLVGAALKRLEARSKERFVFPKVSVGTRLGAPYGGGKVSTRDFGRK